MRSEEHAAFVAELKVLCEREVYQVGGYWPVQVAVDEIGSGLGRATEHVFANRRSQFSEEAFAAIWILTCVANQFCCDLPRAIQEAATERDRLEPLTLRDSGLVAFRHFGSLLRTVNRYENGVYSDERAAEPIAKTIVLMQRALFAGIEAAGASNAQLLEARLKHVRSYVERPDVVPHTPRFDPTTGESLKRFRALAGMTACPFAKTARVWVTPIWASNLDVDRFVKSIRTTLERFSRVYQPEQLDGLVVECFDIGTLDELASRTQILLSRLARLSSRNPFATAQAATRDWKFRLLDLDCFVTVFSSVYPQDHPRYSGAGGSTFFFFQPQSAFSAKKARDKESIREKFAERGQDYRPLLKKAKLEAQKFVKPLNLATDSPVEWWAVPEPTLQSSQSSVLPAPLPLLPDSYERRLERALALKDLREAVEIFQREFNESDLPPWMTDRKSFATALRETKVGDTPPDGEFCCDVLERGFGVGRGILEAMLTLTADMRLRFSKLMFVHEVFHAQQGLTSVNYAGVGRAGMVLEGIDYWADAVAVGILTSVDIRRGGERSEESSSRLLKKLGQGIDTGSGV